MARFDIYTIEGIDAYFIEVQSDTLMPLNTTVVVPLLPVERKHIKRLNPTFVINGERLTMQTQDIAAVRRSELKSCVGKIPEDQETDVTAALDILFFGC